jgi:TRAP-type C4-dicarboxylate transport system permease small subunit
MKLEKLINSFIPIFGGVLLVVIVLLTFLQIVLRQFFDFTFNWSDEVAQFCMTWLALFGSIWATKNNQHLNTGLKLHQRFNERQICLIDSILALVISSIGGMVAYQSAIFAFSSMSADSLSLPWLKMGYVFVAVPFFMLAVCYYYLKSFCKNIRVIFKRQ